MEKKDCKNMSNSEIKLYLGTLQNEFEATKAKIIKLSEHLDEINNEYNNANNELQIRKTIYL